MVVIEQVAAVLTAELDRLIRCEAVSLLGYARLLRR